MSKYYGDINEDATIELTFNTFDSDGASVTVTDFASTDVHVHKDGSDAQSNVGVTIDIDFDTVTGNHIIIIDTSADAFYATGSNYEVRVEGITVATQTINAFIGSFSIENRYMVGTDSAALASVLGAAVGASISADVAAVKAETVLIVEDTAEIGVAGAGLSNINLPNQTMNITGDITGNLSGSVGTVTLVSANGINAASIATDAIDADALAADAITEIWAKAMSDIAQGAPSATASVLTAINYLYEAWRNKTTTTATLMTVFKDDGTTGLAKSTISDDGTTFTKAEFITGA